MGAARGRPRFGAGGTPLGRLSGGLKSGSDFMDPFFSGFSADLFEAEFLRRLVGGGLWCLSTLSLVINFFRTVRQEDWDFR